MFGDSYTLELLAVNHEGRIFKLGSIAVRLPADLTPQQMGTICPIARDAIEARLGVTRRSRRVPVRVEGTEGLRDGGTEGGKAKAAVPVATATEASP